MCHSFHTEMCRQRYIRWQAIEPYTAPQALPCNISLSAGENSTIFALRQQWGKQADGDYDLLTYHSPCPSLKRQQAR